MKVTKRQLKSIILEMVNELQASDKEVSAVKKKLSDEGGAAGADLVAQAARDAEESDVDASDDEIVAALMAKDDSITKHSDGDIIDKGGLKESKKK